MLRGGHPPRIPHSRLDLRIAGAYPDDAGAKHFKPTLSGGAQVGCRCRRRPGFGASLEDLAADTGFACLDEIRRGELLLACRSPARRAEVRRAYVDALLQLRAPPALLRRETIYVSYCEVVGKLRDDVMETRRIPASRNATSAF